MFELTDKVALITGSTKGIGKSIAEEMAKAGAKVVISSRKAEICEQVTKEFTGKGYEAISLPCNIAHKEQLQQLVDATMKHWGRIDILVCNAAANPVYGPTAQAGDDVFDKMMGNNIKSNWWLCNMVIPQMAERKDGAVIIISSIAALKGSTVLGLYGLTKAADTALVRNYACEWGPSNVRVNAILPGLIKTDFARALWQNEKTRTAREQTTPLRRLGEAEEIGGIAVFLASRAGSFITGQAIIADGGVTIA